MSNLTLDTSARRHFGTSFGALLFSSRPTTAKKKREKPTRKWDDLEQLASQIQIEQLSTSALISAVSDGWIADHRYSDSELELE